MNMKYKNLLEINFDDYASDGLKELIKKYKWKDSYRLYVNFTNNNYDNLSKLQYRHSDSFHDDPFGLYAYPLRYVLNNPGDIWYGMSFKTIRIIKDISRNKLILNEVTEDLFLKCFYKLDDKFNITLKNFIKVAKSQHNIGRTKYGKLLLQLIQYDYNLKQVRSSEEQTKLLLFLGYDAIEDKSKSSNTAIINSKEPEQIIFLRNSSFKIIETFKNLHMDKTKNTLPTIPRNHLERKFVSILFKNLFNDKIKNNLSDMYYSNKGYKIQFYLYNDTIQLDKKHKADKKNNMYSICINIFYNDDKLDDTYLNYSFSKNITINSIINTIKNDISGYNTKYNNFSLEKDLEKRKIEQRNRINQQIKDKLETYEELIGKYLFDIEKKYNVKFKEMSNNEKLSLYYEFKIPVNEEDVTTKNYLYNLNILQKLLFDKNVYYDYSDSISYSLVDVGKLLN